MQVKFAKNQLGLSLIGLLFFLVIIGGIALIGLKVLPTVTEYMSIKKSIGLAKASGNNKRDIMLSFDKQADVAYITSITGKDLDIVNENGEFEVSFTYEKKIPLAGPVSLMIDYEGTTRKNGVVTQAPAAPAQ